MACGREILVKSISSGDLKISVLRVTCLQQQSQNTIGRLAQWVDLFYSLFTGIPAQNGWKCRFLQKLGKLQVGFW